LLLWLLAAAAVVGVVAKRPTRPRFDVREVGMGAATGVAMLVGAHVAVDVGTRAVPSLAGAIDTLVALFAAASTRAGPWTAPLVLWIAAAEELIWRTPLDVDAPGRARAIAVSTLLYAGAQAGGGQPLLIAAATGCGAVWAALTSWRGSSTASIVAHLVFTPGVLFVWPLRGM
jgi:uncharacterized protein